MRPWETENEPADGWTQYGAWLIWVRDHLPDYARDEWVEANSGGWSSPLYSLMAKQADTIERLRAELAEANDAVHADPAATGDGICLSGL